MDHGSAVGDFLKEEDEERQKRARSRKRSLLGTSLIVAPSAFNSDSDTSTDDNDPNVFV